MIKTNDLRLGNLIKHNSKGTAVQRLEVIELKKGGVIITKDLNNLSFGTFEEDAEGIPLTPEILTNNLNFKKRFEGEECNIYDMENAATLSGSLSLALLNHGWKYLTAPSAKLLTHLHQLQNLYFALSGEELNIKL